MHHLANWTAGIQHYNSATHSQYVLSRNAMSNYMAVTFYENLK